MTEKYGTEETRQMLTLVLTLATLVAKEIKGDGLQWTDAFKILMSSDFQTKFATAVAGISQLQNEVKDLSSLEDIDLAIFALQGTKTVVQELRGAA